MLVERVSGLLGVSVCLWWSLSFRLCWGVGVFWVGPEPPCEVLHTSVLCAAFSVVCPVLSACLVSVPQF